MKPKMMTMHPKCQFSSWHPCLLPGSEAKGRRCPCCGDGQSGSRRRDGAVDGRCSEPPEPSPSNFAPNHLIAVLFPAEALPKDGLGVGAFCAPGCCLPPASPGRARRWAQLQKLWRAGVGLRASRLIKQITKKRDGQIWARLAWCQHRADPGAHGIFLHSQWR